MSPVANMTISSGRFVNPVTGERTSITREQPSPSDNPRNVFEVIGRWLLGMAEYFEMLIRTLRKFGEFLIEIAKQGYGADLRFPT